MKLPEIHELLKHANPNNMDLYQSTFSAGGELESYAEHIRRKLIQIQESEVLAKRKLEKELSSVVTQARSQ